MINTDNFQQAINQIRTGKEKHLMVKAQSLEFNRRMLEYGKFGVFVGLETPMNHVLAKIATKNKISIGYDMERFRKIMNKKQKAKELSRVIQNIKALRKAKTKMKLLNYEDEKDARDFLISLGASTKQAKEALV